MSESRKRRQSAGLRNRAGSKENLQKNSPQTNRDRGRMNSTPTQMKSGFQRQGSHDNVRKIVQREGRTARNLITWNVPVEEQAKSKSSLNAYMPRSSRSPRPSSTGRRGYRPQRDRSDEVKKSNRSSSDLSDDGHRSSFSLSSPKVGNTPKKGDIRARYWAFLFENLKRAVDEIYQTCESDESVVECKEVILLLEQCTKDFKSLIKRLDLLKAYEKADGANKPTAIAWEVRKMSPGKNYISTDTRTSSPVSRALDFSNPPSPRKTQAESPPTLTSGNSWADKVKGTPSPAAPSVADVLSKVEPERVDVQEAPEEDAEGWATVQRTGRGKYRNSPSQKSMAAKLSQNQQEQQSSHAHLQDGRAKSHKAEHSSPHIQEITIDIPARTRLDSRESEKENQPANIMEVTNLKQQNPPVKEAWLEPQKITSSDDFEDPAIIEKYRGGSETDLGLESEDEKAEEELANQLEQALESVLDEEDSLTNQLEEAQAQALETVSQREQDLEREIQREESMELAAEPEEQEQEEEIETVEIPSLDSSLQQPTDWDSLVERYEAEAEYRKSTSWNDRVEDAESRTPGRGFQMHEKLSSPSRKRLESPSDTRKRYEKKQAKAQELRSKHLHEKAERLRLLTKKVAEVRAYKDEILEQQRNTILRKLQRAEQKRSRQLDMKRKKAHDEEAKANEIAFINSLEAQNKKHDIITKHQESESRLADIQEERLRKHEEKLAKEAAAEERRKALEAERVARLQDMQERRREREKEFEQRMYERERERQEMAMRKEKEREERVMALCNQQEEQIKELQKRIRQRQDDTTRRHHKNLDGIRMKAFEMSVCKHSTEDHNEAPKLQLYDSKKLCTLCHVLIPSEVYLLSHLRGKKHQTGMKERHGGTQMSNQDIEFFNLNHIVDAPTDKPDPQVTQDRERQKALKKRCKKLRQRMTTRGTEYEASLATKQQTADSDHKAKFQKIVKDLTKHVQSQDSGPWPRNRVSGLDRALGEMSRILEKKNLADQNYMRICGAMNMLCQVLLVISDSNTDLPPVIPAKSLVHTCNVVRLACRNCYDNSHYMLFSNRIMSLVDLLIHQLTLLIPDNFQLIPSTAGSGGSSETNLPTDAVATALLQLLATILTCLAKHNPVINSSEASAERMSSSGDAFVSRGNDIISYLVSVGTVDRLTNYFNNVQGPIDNEPEVAELLTHGMGLLTSMTRFLSRRNIFEKQQPEDTTQLITTFEATDLVGIVSLMYGMLLHSGTPARGEISPKDLPAHTLGVTLTAMKMLTNMATLNLHVTQAVLGAEGLSLQFRHIASYLLWYCSSRQNEELLHEVIQCVGYFTALNQENQGIIDSGQPPTVLQQMCSLPFQYFSDPRLTTVLFPTLIACCHNNRRNTEILEQELSSALLANFIEEKQLEVQQAKLVSPTTRKAIEREYDLRMSLAARFPTERWDEARSFFNLD